MRDPASRIAPGAVTSPRPALAREHDRLGTAADGKLVEDMGDRIAHGFFRDHRAARRCSRCPARARADRGFRTRGASARPAPGVRAAREGERRGSLPASARNRGLAFQREIIIGVQGNQPRTGDRRRDQTHFLDGGSSRAPRQCRRRAGQATRASSAETSASPVALTMRAQPGAAALTRGTARSIRRAARALLRGNICEDWICRKAGLSSPQPCSTNLRNARNRSRSSGFGWGRRRIPRAIGAVSTRWLTRPGCAPRTRWLWAWSLPGGGIPRARIDRASHRRPPLPDRQPRCQAKSRRHRLRIDRSSADRSGKACGARRVHGTADRVWRFASRCSTLAHPGRGAHERIALPGDGIGNTQVVPRLRAERDVLTKRNHVNVPVLRRASDMACRSSTRSHDWRWNGKFGI